MGLEECYIQSSVILWQRQGVEAVLSIGHDQDFLWNKHLWRETNLEIRVTLVDNDLMIDLQRVVTYL